MNRLFINNSAGYRLLRTIIQGVIGVLLVNGGDYIMQIFAHIPIPDWVKPILVALIMAVLTPIMKALGKGDGKREMDKGELPEDYWEGDEDE